MNPMETVKMARELNRTLTSEWIELIFDEFMEMHGDRKYADDKAIIGGLATLGDTPVTVIGMEKGHEISTNLMRNFGSAHPEGYRKAYRLMEQAEKFRRPIVTFVNTPGAFCGATAEERGIGESIARNLAFMSHLTVPVVCILAGEGGSGGALALAVANEIWCLEFAMYSILSPEGFASILWKDSSRVDEASRLMKFTSHDLLEQRIVDKVIAERNIPTKKVAATIRTELLDYFNRTKQMSAHELKAQRLERFRQF